MGVLFMACCGALVFTRKVGGAAHGHAAPDAAPEGPPTSVYRTPARIVVAGRAVRDVVRDLWVMLKTKGGLLSAILCVLPVGTGAAQVVLTQAKVAEYWGANESHVEWVQGLLSSIVISAGCFGGGWLCKKMHPRTAYATIGIVLAVIATAMAICPASVPMY